MADPMNQNRLTPFQEAMLKFEQAVRASLEAEVAAQQQARQSMQRQGMPAAQQAPRPPVRQPGYPTVRQPGGPAAPQAAPPAAYSDVPAGDKLSSMPEESDMARAAGMIAGETVAPHVATIDSTLSSMTSTVSEIAPTVGLQSKDTSWSSEVLKAQQKLPVMQMPTPLMQGIVWAEVLGKPVSKRRGRGRHGL